MNMDRISVTMDRILQLAYNHAYTDYDIWHDELMEHPNNLTVQTRLRVAAEELEELSKIIREFKNGK